MKWKDAFLCFIQQRVGVDCIKPDWSTVVSGVLQGTVLDPLWFFCTSMISLQILSLK